MRRCFNCDAELPARERVPFKELCPHCEAFLHCCKNCRLYSSEAHHHCLSSTTEFVPDPERGNYCDEFEFREVEDTRLAEADRPKRDKQLQSRALSARERFENLFKT